MLCLAEAFPPFLDEEMIHALRPRVRVCGEWSGPRAENDKFPVGLSLSLSPCFCRRSGSCAQCMSDDNKQIASAAATSSLHLDFRHGAEEEVSLLPPSSANYPFRHSSLFVSAAADEREASEAS